RPNVSSLTLPMKAARPPSSATPTAVLAAEPPDISMAGPISAYSFSLRSRSTSPIVPFSIPKACTRSSPACASTSTIACPMQTTSDAGSLMTGSDGGVMDRAVERAGAGGPAGVEGLHVGLQDDAPTGRHGGHAGIRQVLVTRLPIAQQVDNGVDAAVEAHLAAGVV